MCWRYRVLGKVSKGEACSLCGKPAVKSISAVEASKYFKVQGGARGRVYLCKEHYKEYKKLSKKDREIERLRW